MRVDERIEPRLREAYSAVIAKDADRVSAALRGMSNEDTATFLGLGLYVCGFIVNDIYKESVTDANVRELAEKIIAKQSDWMDIGEPEVVAAFLKAAATGDTRVASLGGEDLTGLTIICGGHLLGYYRLEGQRWYEYLDEIWSAVEAAPDPS
jgi:hypothetical protein